jgi:hypothetical protein
VVIVAKTSSSHGNALARVGFTYDENETLTHNIITAASKCSMELNRFEKEQRNKKPSDFARAIEQLLETGNHEDRGTMRLLMNYDNRFRIR